MNARPLALSVGACLLLSLAMGPLRGADGHGFAHPDSNAPVNFAADHMELLDKENRVVLTGNVDITQADLRLTAARGMVSYSNNKDALEIHRFDASGAVAVTRGDESARGDVAIYDVDQRIITMVGNVVLHRGADVLNGGRMVIDLDSGLTRIDGRGVGGPAGASGEGRVSGTFTVPKKNEGSK